MCCLQPDYYFTNAMAQSWMPADRTSETPPTRPYASAYNFDCMLFNADR